jgi:EamA domain-containing membrane protein RarD
MNATTLNIDKMAIGLSMICTVHCLLLPIALVILPTLSASIFGDEGFHQWLLIAVIPTSVIALSMGCKSHKKFSVITTGLLGLVILTLAAFFGHDLLGELGETMASLFGALLIISSHLRNYALCKDLQCQCETP